VPIHGNEEAMGVATPAASAATPLELPAGLGFELAWTLFQSFFRVPSSRPSRFTGP
jgi:hypothetical protein